MSNSAHSLHRARYRIARSLIICSIATIGGAAEAATNYTPTMADMMSIQATLANLHDGADRHDDTLLASAFTEDGTYALIERGVLVASVTGRDKIAAGGLLGAMASPGPPGAPKGAPPPGAAPLPGAGPGASPPPPGEIWHFSTNDRFKFVSPTQVEHYAYWLDLRPGAGREWTAGVPGHYEDVLVKKDGDWLLQRRTIVVGVK